MAIFQTISEYTERFFTQAMASTHNMMLWVILALLPGCLVSTYFFGYGILVNVSFSICLAILLEAGMLRLRGKPLSQLFDLSAVVTAILLALALPPALPLWMLGIGILFAIVFAKHIYGGLGQNTFNPAMVGYAVLIISFPLAMSTWPIPIPIALPSSIDALSGATPLDILKFRGATTIDEMWLNNVAFDEIAGRGWQWINLSYLAGGLLLIYLKVARWQSAFAMLTSLALLAAIFYDNGGSNSLGSPLFHLFSGGTMLVAFFIVTDPVTSPDNHWGLMIFGIGCGGLIFLIRSVGAYPDGAAFAIILMNALVPLIETLQLRLLNGDSD